MSLNFAFRGIGARVTALLKGYGMSVRPVGLTLRHGGPSVVTALLLVGMILPPAGATSHNDGASHRARLSDRSDRTATKIVAAPKVTPTAPIAGEYVTVTGRVPSGAKRPVRLQRLVSGAWKTVKHGASK